MGVRIGVRQCYNRRGSQTTGSRLHTRSILSRLTGQRGDGQEGQQKVEDVCGLHGLKQGMPQNSIARH